MVSARHKNHKTIYGPSQGSLSISLATLAHRWVPYAARYRTDHLDISHSSQHVPQLANAVVNPVKDTLNFGEISSGNRLPPTSAVCTGDDGRSEGPGTVEDETSSVVGGGIGVFESDFA
jgi:hypothetical protein